MIQLYPDQQETIDKLRASMRANKSILLQSPTGSGKTAMATYLITSAVNKGRRVMFTVPRKELARQTSLSFEENGVAHGFVASGHGFNPFAKTYIGMIDTMARRLDKLPVADLAIIDEAHFGAASLDSVIRAYKDMGAYVVGLSATPWKLSGEGLGKWYADMVCGPDIAWLIENKRLSDYRMFAPSEPDLSGIDITAGDYSKGQLAGRMESDRKLIGDAVKHYREKAMGRLNIAYCTSIKHSQIVAESFSSQGIPAAHIDGMTPDDEKRQIIRGFARRDILVLCNCELLTFGFDLKMASGLDVTIEAMSDLRPTKSLALQMQKWGRVLRYKDYPAMIFDHAGNVGEFGLPCAEREWTLEGRKQGKRGGEKAPPTRQCGECFFVHSPAPVCPDCGHVYEIKGREVDEVDGELSEIDRKAQEQTAKVSRRIEQAKATSLDDLIELGKQRGMKHPAAWAAKVFSARMGKAEHGRF